MIDYREPFEANSRGASTSEHRENGKSPAVHKDKDPIRIYLKEMGMVSLLDREGEVKVAQRIEKGQKKVMESLSRSPAGMAELLGLGRLPWEMRAKAMLEISLKIFASWIPRKSGFSSPTWIR